MKFVNIKDLQLMYMKKSKCRWKKVSKNQKQRVCCTWTRTRINGHNQDSKKDCKKVGQVIEVSKKLDVQIDHLVQ